MPRRVSSFSGLQSITLIRRPTHVKREKKVRQEKSLIQVYLEELSPILTRLTQSGRVRRGDEDAFRNLTSLLRRQIETEMILTPTELFKVLRLPQRVIPLQKKRELICRYNPSDIQAFFLDFLSDPARLTDRELQNLLDQCIRSGLDLERLEKHPVFHQLLSEYSERFPGLISRFFSGNIRRSTFDESKE